MDPPQRSGRGGGKESRGNGGRGNGSRGRGGRGGKGKPNYIDLGKKQLTDLFPELSQTVVYDTFHAMEHDMAASIKELSKLAGREVLDETETLHNPLSGFTLEEHQGDLFAQSSETVAFGHCVSVCLKMGKGIAVEFKSRFGQVDKLIAQNQGVGGVAHIVHGKRHVYYLTTKPNYYDKPTYSDLQASLVLMKDLCIEHGVTELALPRIGCGLDGLIWSQVKLMLKDVFWDSNITIRIYRL